MQKMSEKEALEILKTMYPKKCKMVDGRLKGGFDNHECKEGQVLDMAIKALEEIQQYRAIGTVEELKELKYNGAFSGIELANIAASLAELQKYQAIGTPDQCREAVERMKPKGFIQTEKFNTTMWQCPICYSELYSGQNYCDECGNLIGWDGLE